MCDLTTRHQAINERLFPLKEILFDGFPPLIPIEHKLVFKKINICSLVPVGCLSSTRIIDT